MDPAWPDAGFPVPALRTQPTVSLIGTLEPAVPLQQASAVLKSIDLTSDEVLVHERFVGLTAEESSPVMTTLQQDGACSENVRYTFDHAHFSKCTLYISADLNAV